MFREDSGESNGMTFDLQGRLVVCEMINRRVTRREDDGSYATLAESCNGQRISRPNDVIGRSDGSLYFTNPGRERLDPADVEMQFNSVHRIRPDGSVDMLVPGFQYPNGLAFSPDESVLYVANTRPGQYILAFDLDDGGDVCGVQHFADMPSDIDTNGVPDGMKVDIEGRVYCTGPDGCWVFEPSGELNRHHPPARISRQLRMGRSRQPHPVPHRQHIRVQPANDHPRNRHSPSVTPPRKFNAKAQSKILCVPLRLCVKNTHANPNPAANVVPCEQPPTGYRLMTLPRQALRLAAVSIALIILGSACADASAPATTVPAAVLDPSPSPTAGLPMPATIPFPTPTARLPIPAAIPFPMPTPMPAATRATPDATSARADARASPRPSLRLRSPRSATSRNWPSDSAARSWTPRLLHPPSP